VLKCDYQAGQKLLANTYISVVPYAARLSINRLTTVSINRYLLVGRLYSSANAIIKDGSEINAIMNEL
jgi:hypothetical protein